MARMPKTIRLPKALEDDLESEFARRGVKEWSAGVVGLLEEAIRMRRVPGIIFTDSISGRRPVLAGTGLDIWEVIATWKQLGRDESQLGRAYHWLSPALLRVALAYYLLYPQEIDDRIALEESWTPERIRRELPFAALGPGIVAETKK